MDFDANYIAYNPRDEKTAREKKADLRIKVKVAVLEVWRKEGVPEGCECPYNQSMFQQWEDDGLDVKIVLDGEKRTVNKVFKVTAVTVDKPNNSGLKARAIALMDAIRNRPTPKKENAKLKAERAEQEAVIQELTNQTAELRYEIAALKKDLKAKDTELQTLIGRNNKLQAELNKVLPFEPKIVN
jgi:uncharacterized coiled-coil protein SlyX